MYKLNWIIISDFKFVDFVYQEDFLDLPSLLKVISNKWIINISETPFIDAFHGLKKKWLVLGVHILYTLWQGQN